MNTEYLCKRLLCRICILMAIVAITSQNSYSQPATGSAGSNIRLNQLGFYPQGPKIAIVLNSKSEEFYLQTLDKKNVLVGKLKKSVRPGLNRSFTDIADFGIYNTPGKYQLYVPGSGYSYPFEIKKSVHHNVAAGAIKAYYFMRASIPLKGKYAGKWSRAEGHPDTNVLIHPSAVSDKRPAGTSISAPRGWYDAGDYNKYIVNSGISTSTLLSLYEDFPAYMKTVNLNIPESGNKIPDVLNEVLWNLRWMLAMQDPEDGGVYNKLTNAEFDKMEMPDKGTQPRYVVQKGTAATLDFAAVMAQASRILKKFPKQLPGLADSCLAQANKAWAWAMKNPGVVYNQDAMNQKFNPKVITGGYGDWNFKDEFIWAASELFVTTLNPGFLKQVNLLPDTNMPLPTWSQVRLLGYYTLVKNSSAFGAKAPAELPEIKRRLLAFADKLVNGADETAYQTVMTKSARNFGWGSNSVAANQGVALIQAYKLSPDKKYLNYALANLDYILGRNAAGYSYVTGFGSKTPMHPHHRPSVADGVVDPIPGLLAGGPNPGMQDKIRVPSTVPDEAYIDDDRAYAANEIAINWNAPFAYLANAIEALQNQLNTSK
ncbi:glycoside hydrolase family 9 protein [Mucilaginibacter sp. BJC16-A38]|uniref:glycoside hydrolase family 9 protein n=1 Tax=Mucilaginibacter phenanthrenivorans TaxID=1234842 RepID=UPI002157E95C|nr:glycoside hydrolase family 9 protein [Mucilaginibacter phenanthrenivorans]MCR8556853.1 glycoside hydrolase family 9 protein [Mucilaginibacter phenanthrenivorans]